MAYWKKEYKWDEINEALMKVGYSPKRIGDVLIALTKVKEEVERGD